MAALLISQRRRVRDGYLKKLGELDENEVAILQYHVDHLNRFKRLPQHPLGKDYGDEFEDVD